MLTKLKNTFNKYPKQFWLLFTGMFIAMVTGTMIWPLLMIYVSKKLSMPLAQIASLLTINAAVGVMFTFLAGSLADKFGRKWMMVFGLLINAGAYFFMIDADTYAYFAVLMAISGFANPLFRVGADAMLTDIISEEKRLDAFALTRIAKNVGVSMGPAIGGILASISYTISFISAGTGMIVFSLIIIFFAKETLPTKTKEPVIIISPQKVGYKEMLKDKEFVAMIALYAFGWTTAALMWMLLPVYANQEYGISEKLYGLIPATNGIMVIALQLFVTKYTKRFRPLPMIDPGYFYHR